MRGRVATKMARHDFAPLAAFFWLALARELARSAPRALPALKALGQRSRSLVWRGDTRSSSRHTACSSEQLPGRPRANGGCGSPIGTGAEAAVCDEGPAATKDLAANDLEASTKTPDVKSEP
eukprot:COSAG06_NODE_1339_length_9813_cov_44.214639_11_plen_122_part_00